ncbi:MAG: methyltransferase family protein [Planctomycetota bacterium]
MTYLPIAILSINFCCFLFDIIFPSNKNRIDHFLKLPVLLQKLYVIVVVGPLFIAPLFPQNRFNINPYFSLPAGILLFVLGWIIIIYAFLKIGVIPAIRKKSDLITSGIYRFIRHPIYSGTLIAVLGWSILFKSIILTVYFPLLFLLYFAMTFFEEKCLIEEYGDEYINYKKKVTKRFIPFIF